MSEQSPQVYGYARMPRIIRKGYKHLTKLQKLLYIYLRDLCGESGVCYRSLRTLAEETDFSIGFLSENIPLLDHAGLIQAKKMKRDNKKWEVWHITIVDIWEENATFIQSEKCSQDEQITDVHDMNGSPDEHITPKTVHRVNENSQKCSRGANNREKSMNKNPLLNKRENPKEQPQQQTEANPSPSLQSQKKMILEKWYAHFDILYRSKPGTPANFKVPRSPKNDTAILSMEDAGVTFEQSAFVFNDIWDDPDAFWKANRTITSVNSQFATRIGKMSNQTDQAPPMNEIEPQLEDMLIFGRPPAYWTPERIADEEKEYKRNAIRMLLGQDMEPAIR